MLKKEWELGRWVARFLERSGATLTMLDFRSYGRWGDDDI
jgi:hypothetical protein